MINLSTLNVEAFLQGNTFLQCNCAGSGFIDKDHRYIVKGIYGLLEIINWGSYLLRALNIKKPIIFHGKKLNLLHLRDSMIILTWRQYSWNRVAKSLIKMRKNKYFVQQNIFKASQECTPASQSIKHCECNSQSVCWHTNR